MPIRVRADSRWNVPEPELTLVANARGEIVGHTIGNDVSSRDIEGENPLYLPQAKVYNGSCALGPGIVLGGVERLAEHLKQLTIKLAIAPRRQDRVRGGDAHLADQAAARGAGRVPRPRVGFSARRLSVDRDRYRAADRVLALARRRRPDHDWRDDAREPGERMSATKPVLIAGEWRPAQSPVRLVRGRRSRNEDEPPRQLSGLGRRGHRARLRGGGRSGGDSARRAPRDHRAVPRGVRGRHRGRRRRTLVELAATRDRPAAPRRAFATSSCRGRPTSCARARPRSRDRSWCHATIDTKANLRSMYGPLGPVCVFGPNNFPFAFNSVAGGDFVAAIAAGNPVIAQGQHRPPGDVAAARRDRVRGGARRRGCRQRRCSSSIGRRPTVGFELVSHPLRRRDRVHRSKRAGLELKAAADRAGKPIYLEMSSVNPVFVLPGALEERSAAIAKELHDSMHDGSWAVLHAPRAHRRREGRARRGVPCRGDGDAGEDDARHAARARRRRRDRRGARRLCPARRRGRRPAAGPSRAHGPRSRTRSCAFRGAGFLAAPEALQTEAFGSVNMVVVADGVAEMAAIAEALDGNLTGSIYSDTTGRDDAAYARVEPRSAAAASDGCSTTRCRPASPSRRR